MSRGILKSILKHVPSRRFKFLGPPEITRVSSNKPKYCDAETAVKCVESGDMVFAHGIACTPIHLLKALTVHGKVNKLKNVKIIHIHTEGKAWQCEPDMAEIFQDQSLFIAGNVRKAIAEGRAECIPIFLGDIPSLFFKGIICPRVSLIQVSPPDSKGYASLGLSVDCVRAALQHSEIIIAQINEKMPRTYGDSLIHESCFDYAVCHNSDLPLLKSHKIGEEEKKIGSFIAKELVEDGATLQLGIGSIPDAVVESLANHKDLGVHTEMFSNGYLPLIKCGVITNHKKTLNQGRSVTAFLLGSQELLDFVHDNPAVEFRVVNYTNSVFTIARMPKMTAINSCIEVDLTGQVVSDSIGTRMFSGFGGQVDFIRGAAEGLDGKGKPIIAMQSMNKKNKQSKIVPFIRHGAGVVTTRAHVHYVVTEYGIASLFGKNLRQRAYELIKIAHPDVRESLEKAACKRLNAMPSKD